MRRSRKVIEKHSRKSNHPSLKFRLFFTNKESNSKTDACAQMSHGKPDFYTLNIAFYESAVIFNSTFCGRNSISVMLRNTKVNSDEALFIHVQIYRHKATCLCFISNMQSNKTHFYTVCLSRKMFES